MPEQRGVLTCWSLDSFDRQAAWIFGLDFQGCFVRNFLGRHVKWSKERLGKTSLLLQAAGPRPAAEAAQSISQSEPNRNQG